MLTLTLPVAPPANNAFPNRKGGKGRVKSAKYRAWIKQADAHYVLQKLQHETPIRGPYICGMIFPRKTRGDLDGRGKIILDWMVSRGLTSDDRFVQALLCVRDDIPDGYVKVQVVERAYAGSFMSSAAALTE